MKAPVADVWQRSALTYRVIESPDPHARATIIALHDTEANGDEILPFLNAIGWSGRVMTVLPPRGVYVGRRLVGRSWFCTAPTGDPETSSFGESLWHLERFVLDHFHDSDEPASRPLLLSYGQGAILAVVAISYLLDRVRGVIAINGYIPRLSQSVRLMADLARLPVFLLSDRENASLRLDELTKTCTWLRENNARVRHEVIAGSDLRAPDVAMHVRDWLNSHALSRAQDKCRE